MNDSEHPIDDAESTNSDGGIATLDAHDDSQVAAKPTGPCCEKCSAPFSSKAVTICRSCGWYSSLGRFVEVDPNWEAASSGTPAATAPQKLGPLEWLQLIPRWGWLVIASAFVIVLESIAVRLATADGSSLRTAWSSSMAADRSRTI